MKRILVLGVSGMLGNAVYRFLSANPELFVIGSMRSSCMLTHFSDELKKNIMCGVDVENVDEIINLFSTVKPEVVINCIGLVKQLSESNSILSAIPVNTVLPHRLAKLCAVAKARLIHISTDCVFSGKRGNYDEQAISDAEDIYGKSKFLGEVSDPDTITLRTSIIGHELNSNRGLVDWFLKQEKKVKGYTHAIFSGLPTVELARVISDYVLPNGSLSGVYHVSSDPISKFDLLHLIANCYGKKIEIVPDDNFVLDRSLNSTQFQRITGYQAPSWPELVKRMYEFNYV